MSYSADILIVEDEKIFSDFLKQALSFNGYAIRIVQTGQDALKCISHANTDLVLLDIGLPDMDGYSLLERICKETPDIPVILMTGNATVESATRALKSGAYDYLAKPLEPGKLLNTIQNALESKWIEKQRQKAVEKLGESEEKYHRLFESVTDAIVIFDAETLKFEDANQAALDLFGYSMAEFCNLTVEDISAEKEKTQKALQRVKNGEFGSIMVPVRHLQKKDGFIFPGEISSATFMSGDRKKIIGAIRNISERMQAQKELLKAKVRLEHLLVSSPAIIYSANPDDNSISYISDNVKLGLGYDWISFVEDPGFWVNQSHPDDVQLFRLGNSKLEKVGNRVNEYRFKHKDGNYRWFRDESRLIRDEHNHPIEVVGSWIDITETKNAESKLRESEERFRNLVENSLIGISIIQNNLFVYKNPAQQKMRGSISQEKVSDLLADIHPEDIAKVKAAYAQLISGEIESVETDVRFYPSGSASNKANLRWVQCRASAIKYRGQDAILTNIVDITKTKELEQQLIIKNKMISLGRVAAGIAHEIRNPLTGINSYLFTLNDLCQSESLDFDDREMMGKIVDQIQTASNKIESVIKRVMDFSKPGAPKMVKTDINLALEEAIGLSAVTLRQNGIKIERSLSQNIPECYADPLLIEQVILNLITNAAKAIETSNGLKIVGVESYSENNTLFISVSDSGPGVSLDLKEKIFDPFFTTKEEGSGIGLNIAQRIIADHNGSISLGNSKWGGAEFTIRLPIERRIYPR